MLAMFQHAAIEMMEKDEQSLVPFNIFYDALSQFIDHSHSSVIIKAGKNELLTDFERIGDYTQNVAELLAYM